MTKIIVGLGNPGKEYIRTRHNVGFVALDSLVDSQSQVWSFDKKFNAQICKTADYIFLKPMTFMNNSGRAVESVMSYYKLLPKTLGIVNKKNADLESVLLVIHDDVDIDLGKYKISYDSRSAGHRGVESIIETLKTKKFTRIRIGVKTSASEKMPTDKFVLGKFNKEEMDIIEDVIAELDQEI